MVFVKLDKDSDAGYLFYDSVLWAVRNRFFDRFVEAGLRVYHAFSSSDDLMSMGLEGKIIFGEYLVRNFRDTAGGSATLYLGSIYEKV